MGAEHYQQYILRKPTLKEYLKTWYPDTDSDPEPCTMKATSYCSNMSGSFIVNAVRKLITNQPYDKKFSFLSHYVGNRILTIISNQFTGLRLTDMETCYKMFTKEILDKIHLTENKFGFEPEFTAQIAKINCRISEVGIKYKNRSYEEGKKITWKDGIHALKVIIKYGLK